jgi:phosphate transport system protein
MINGIRIHFNLELLRLQEDVLQLGFLARASVASATQALITADADLAADVIAADGRINDLRFDVESECYVLLATEQPVAGDMRRIVSLLTIANDLERIGDHGKKIARLSLQMNGSQRSLPPAERAPSSGPRGPSAAVQGALPWGSVQRMCELSLKMLDDALHALAAHDVAEARAVCAQDDQVDALYKQMFNVALTYMLESPRAIAPGTYQIQIGHELERVADRATNIAERLIYAATGDLLDLNM